MTSINTDMLSPFGQLALKLDQDFSGLDRLSGQLSRLDLESDNGLEQAMKLLTQFSHHGESISAGMQDFAQSLEEARTKAEKATADVAARAQLVQQRQLQLNDMQERLNQLASRVQGTNAALEGFKKDSFTEEEKIAAQERLRMTDVSLEGFVAEALLIKEDAKKDNFRKLERSAESLAGTLSAARRKLSAVL